MRLERIGDLLMTIDAIGDAARAWPDATLDLAVGSWNRDLATLIPGITHVHVADVPWLSRGEAPTSWPALVDAARNWKRHHYDAIVNFEPDIRSNALAWLAGAPARYGYATGGGGAFLTSAIDFDPTSHVETNARRLVAHASARAFNEPAGSRTTSPRLLVPGDLRARVRARLGPAPRPWIGVHPSGGRASKQWHLDRFADTGRALQAATGGTLVLTGSPSDTPLVDTVRQHLGVTPAVTTNDIDDLRESAALLAELDVLVASDTGPAHLAAAVDTPVVVLFGPADPARYGPRAARERIVRVALPCSPCGLVRLPPERCRGHVPDCMDGITVETVVQATLDLLRAPSTGSRTR
jgi:ADP-heptose:LPS heptosyltransferase